MSEFNLAIESASSPVGPATGIGYLYDGGSMRFINNNNAKFRVTQVGSGVDVTIEVINVNPSSTIFPQVLSATPTFNGNYSITGVGQPNSTITINGVSAPVLYNGNFTITTRLNNGKNSVSQVNAGGELTNSIYIISGMPTIASPVVITSFTDNGDNVYDLTGSGPPNSTITIGNQQITIPSTGVFTVNEIQLSTGTNYITSGSTVIGSFFVQAGSSSATATVIDIVDYGLGSYSVYGIGTPGLVIQINNSPDITINQDGAFTGTIITLNPGNNEITSDGMVIGGVYVQAGQEVIVADVTVNGSNYDISGTGPDGDYIINNTQFSIDGNQFSLTNIPLVANSNNTITNPNDEIVGSVYVQSVVEPNVEVIITSITSNSDGSYLIEGTTNAEDGQIITIGGKSASINNGQFTVGQAELEVAIPNDVTIGSSVVSSIYVQSNGSLVINSITEDDSVLPTYTVTVTSDQDMIVYVGNTGPIPLTAGIATPVPGVDLSEVSVPINQVTADDVLIGQVGMIYLKQVFSTTVSVDSVTSSGNSYGITGTGLDGSYTINDTQFSINGNQFSAPEVYLNNNSNNTILNSNGDVVGSVYVSNTVNDVSFVTVTEIEANGFGNYYIAGTGSYIPTFFDPVYSINGTELYIMNDEIFDSVVNLNPGANYITLTVDVPGTGDPDGNGQEDRETTTVGSIYLQLNTSVIITDVNSNTITGTGPVGEYSINSMPFNIININQFTAEVTLVPGINNILNVNGEVVGSVYVESVSSSVIVTNVIQQSELNTYTISGSGSDGSYSVNGTSITIVDNIFTDVTVTLNGGVNTIVIDGSTTVVGSIYLQPDQSSPVVVGSIIPISSNTYNITGAGPAGSYTMNGTEFNIDIDGGPFSLNNIQLDSNMAIPIINTATNATVGSIYIQSTQPVIITSAVVDPNAAIEFPDTYLISGTGPNGIYHINGVEFTIANGIFTNISTLLNSGINNVTLTDDVTVVGSFYLQSRLVVVTSVTLSFGTSNYDIAGVGVDGNYRIENVGTTFSIVDGVFSLTTPLNPGLSIIRDMDGNGPTMVGSIYVQVSTPVVMDSVIVTEAVPVVGSPDTYSLTGTGSDGTYHINGVEFTIENAPFTVTAPLDAGINYVTFTDDVIVVGSFYLEVQPSVTVTIVTLDMDGTYTINGNRPIGLSVTINGQVDSQPDNPTFEISGVNLNQNTVNDITATATGIVVGSLYLEVQSGDPSIVNSLIVTDYDMVASIVTIAGTGGPVSGTVAVNTDPIIIESIDASGNWSITYDSANLTAATTQLIFTDINGNQSPPIIIIPPIPIPPTPAAPIVAYAQAVISGPINLTVDLNSILPDYSPEYSVDGGDVWNSLTSPQVIPNSNYSDGAIQVRQVSPGLPTSEVVFMGPIISPYIPSSLNLIQAAFPVSGRTLNGSGVAGHRIQVPGSVAIIINNLGQFNNSIANYVSYPIGTLIDVDMFNGATFNTSTLRGTASIVSIDPSITLESITGTYSVLPSGVVTIPSVLGGSTRQYSLNGGRTWTSSGTSTITIPDGLYNDGAIQLRRINGTTAFGPSFQMSSVISPYLPMNVRVERVGLDVNVSGTGDIGAIIIVDPSGDTQVNSYGHFSVLLINVIPLTVITIVMSKDSLSGSVTVIAPGIN